MRSSSMSVFDIPKLSQEELETLLLKHPEIFLNLHSTDKNDPATLIWLIQNRPLSKDYYLLTILQCVDQLITEGYLDKELMQRACNMLIQPSLGRLNPHPLIHTIAQNANAEAVKLVMKYQKIPIDSQVAVLAAMGNHIDTLQLLQQQLQRLGLDINMPATGSGETPLHSFPEREFRIETADFLLKEGADIDAPLTPAPLGHPSTPLSILLNRMSFYQATYPKKHLVYSGIEEDNLDKCIFLIERGANLLGVEDFEMVKTILNTAPTLIANPEKSEYLLGLLLEKELIEEQLKEREDYKLYLTQQKHSSQAQESLLKAFDLKQRREKELYYIRVVKPHFVKAATHGNTSAFMKVLANFLEAKEYKQAYEWFISINAFYDNKLIQHLHLEDILRIAHELSFAQEAKINEKSAALIAQLSSQMMSHYWKEEKHSDKVSAKGMLLRAHSLMQDPVPYLKSHREKKETDIPLIALDYGFCCYQKAQEEIRKASDTHAQAKILQEEAKEAKKEEKRQAALEEKTQTALKILEEWHKKKEENSLATKDRFMGLSKDAEFDLDSWLDLYIHAQTYTPPTEAKTEIKSTPIKDLEVKTSHEVKGNPNFLSFNFVIEVINRHIEAGNDIRAREWENIAKKIPNFMKYLHKKVHSKPEEGALDVEEKSGLELRKAQVVFDRLEAKPVAPTPSPIPVPSLSSSSSSQSYSSSFPSLTSTTTSTGTGAAPATGIPPTEVTSSTGASSSSVEVKEITTHQKIASLFQSLWVACTKDAKVSTSSSSLLTSTPEPTLRQILAPLERLISNNTPEEKILHEVRRALRATTLSFQGKLKDHHLVVQSRARLEQIETEITQTKTPKADLPRR